MLRVHFQSFAIYSLIGVLVASPIMAASPGAASRQAALRAKSARQTVTNPESAATDSGVQNALGLRPFGQRDAVQQVVGKQPTAAKVAPNRSLSLLPSLFGNSRQSPSTNTNTQNHRTANTQHSTTQRSTTQRSSSNSNVSPNGILSDIFGSKSESQPPAAQPIDSPPPTVDWQGIPYHQARSKPAPQTRTPIRDPGPNETRLGSSRLTNQPPAESVAAPTQQFTPAIPQPPAFSPAPSSRRSTPARVVSSRIERNDSPVLSPLSSSRRSGRREVPTLDASEIAAAKNSAVDQQDLAPKVARREVAAEPSTDEIAQSETKPEQPTATPKPSQEEPQSTPSADVAIKPQPTAEPATLPAPEVEVQPDSTPASEMTVDPSSVAETTVPAPVSETAPALETAPTPAPAAPLAASETTAPPASQPPAPAADLQLPAQNNFAAQAPAPQQLPAETTAVAPSTPQFVTPRLPVPATPNFGPDGSVAGHRIGPPQSAFQPRTQPRAALNPANVPFGPAGAPVGSGLTAQSPAATAPQPTSPAFAAPQRQLATQPQFQQPQFQPPQYQQPQFQQPQHVAQNPYQNMRDPYSAPQPTMPPQTQPAPAPASSLGAPQPAVAANATPPSLAANASPVDQFPVDHSAQNTFVDRPFQSTPQPRPVANRTANSELPASQTAVASELPGIRVVTHGPRSVIIRQTHEFEIRVENRGSIDATGVMVRTVIPQWADVKGQSNSKGRIENQTLEDSDRLVWTLDSLPAGTTEKLFVRLQALQSGTHGLDVDWTLIPQKSVAKIEVREPKLDLVIEGPEQVVFGESQTYKVRVLNPGDGVAPNVVFTLSPNSSTPQTQRIGDIPSGKEAQFEVELTAQDLGDLKIHGLAAGDLGLKAQAEKTIQVSSAELEAVLAGPEMKYQNTDGSYHLQVTNNGTATCKNITATLALPPGIRYLGGIDTAQQRGTKLAWQIDSLPPGATRDYEFTCTMVSPGKQTFDFAAHGSAAGKTSVALGTQVESIADLVMTIQDPAAPAPVGSEVVYEILIKNRGSRQAQGVRAIAQFSNGIEPRRIEGHSGQVLTGQVLFDPIEAIRPGEEVRIRVIAEAENEGHHRFRTEIRSGETVLVAEEATQFLSKRSERVSRRSSSSSR